MSKPRLTPKPGDVLTGDDGDAIVVGDDWSVLDALIEIVRQHGCPGTEEELRANPVLVEAASRYKIETWRSCTAAYYDVWGDDEEESPGWGMWAEDGDGKRSIRVVWLEESACHLAEQAEYAADGGQA